MIAGKVRLAAAFLLLVAEQLGDLEGADIDLVDRALDAASRHRPDGRLVGVNSAILSQTGNSIGIGFAIPTKLAMEIMRAIIQQGRVIRGWLGIEIQPLTPELAESFGMEGRPGIIVAGLYRNGPGNLAGLQPGDVILSIDGEPASNGRRSMNQVARSKPGDSVNIEVLRNGQTLQLTAEVGVRPPPPAKDSAAD